MTEYIIFLLLNQEYIMKDLQNILNSNITVEKNIEETIKEYINNILIEHYSDTIDQESLLMLFEDKEIKNYKDELIHYFTLEDINEYKNTLH